MSFSGGVKEELARQMGKSHHCRIAELAGMLEMEGCMDLSSGELRLLNDNAVLQNKYVKLLKSVFGSENVSAEQVMKSLHWDRTVYAMQREGMEPY